MQPFWRNIPISLIDPDSVGALSVMVLLTSTIVQRAEMLEGGQNRGTMAAAFGDSSRAGTRQRNTFMHSNKSTIHLVAACAVLVGFVASAAPALAASKERVLYSFCSASNCVDGAHPDPTLIFDTVGNLYGTTFNGGARGYGSVFQLALENGTWTEKVLHSFCSAGPCTDGENPIAGLIFDVSGNLYGTTYLGGAYGGGTVIQLSPGANNTWTEKVLYSFCSTNNCLDGAEPRGGLIFDGTGNLYGTTSMGGAGAGCNGYGCGTVFKLSPGANGTWTETVLHTFGNGEDGTRPWASLVFDTSGNLYGTTITGGVYPDGGYGTAFRLAPGSNGTWTETVLHSFGNIGDGVGPVASLVFDATGNLYGTTTGRNHVGPCGIWGCGTVFRLEAGADGKWEEKVLHAFNGKDGNAPWVGLIFDKAGNLYGTTVLGGNVDCKLCSKGHGTAFQLTPGGNGKWKENVLYRFCSAGSHCRGGGKPAAGLIVDAAGNLYGTATMGGAHRGGGTVFEITP